MARPRGKIEGLAAIDRSINVIRGNVDNLLSRVQDTAVAIVEHGAGKGNGDMSRALLLCQAIAKHRTLQVNYLVGWFAYFGNCNVNMSKATVKLVNKDSKRYRGFDVDGARANNWFEAVDANGDRATWYAGPTPEAYEPDSIGDIADSFHRFVKNTAKKLDGTKEVNGKEVPLVVLTKEQRVGVDNALAFLDRIANTLARHEDIQKLTAELQKATEEAEQDDTVVSIIQPKEEAVA